MIDEDYVRRDPRMPNTKIRMNDNGEYEYREPVESGMMPYSLFFVLKIIFGFLLIAFIPFLIIDFKSWIKSYVNILIIFIIIMAVSKKMGIGLLDD